MMVLMQSLFQEKVKHLQIRDIEANDALGSHDCRVEVHSSGICGSDVHNYEYGCISSFVASGTVVAVGSEVTHLKIGDRVAMEPGVPRWNSTQTMNGIYNLEPNLIFWATPPVRGCLSSAVIHPAALCLKLPKKCWNKAGGCGAGTVGIVTASCALAEGGRCAGVIITDALLERLEIAAECAGVHPVLSSDARKMRELVDGHTDDQGVDRVFERTGFGAEYDLIYEYAAPGSTVVLVEMPVKPVMFDVVSAQAKEITFQIILRYRNVYPRIIRLISSGKLNVRPLITVKMPFKESVKAYERTLERKPTDIKIMIGME